MVNPAIGLEATLDDTSFRPASEVKRVLVVGGGPAGMEAARVAALRGHSVILAEASSDLGGAVRIAAKVPTRHGIADIVTWLEDEIFRLGVDVRLNTFIEVDDIVPINPDHVIVATGSFPRMDGVQLSHPGEPIQGIDGHHVMSSWDLLLDTHRALGASAVVIDDLGHYEAVGVAEYLVEKGIDVTFVSRHISFAPGMEAASSNGPAINRLMSKSNGKFKTLLRTRVISIDQNDVVVFPSNLEIDPSSEVGKCNVVRIPAETVIFISHNKPNTDLADSLRSRGFSTDLVGDARSPRFLQVAMREGRMAGIAV